MKHYYHRFTRSIFWEIEDMIPFASHPLYRFFWGWCVAALLGLVCPLPSHASSRSRAIASPFSLPGWVPLRSLS